MEKHIDGQGFISDVKLRAQIRSSRNHSEAERRRRQRINDRLATLRGLVAPPNSRMDKAALLAAVVRRVQELRGKLAGEEVPGVGDEVGVEVEKKGGPVRAWVCCEDRPGLMGELSRAIRSVRAKVVRAEIVSVGGRTRSVMEVEMDGPGRAGLEEALKAVLLEKEPGSGGDKPKRATV